LAALDQLIDLGVHRVMTSGGRPSASAGTTVLAKLVERAAGRIEVLPAGGIRAANAVGILARTRCDQLHTSARDRDGRMSSKLLTELLRAVKRPRV
jgi:copper homeostasis protein